MLLASSLRAAACACLLVAASVATAQTTIESRVAASKDDAEQFADSTMYVGSSDLELIHDSSDQTVGMRFAGLTIPPGVTITAAWIQFTSKAAQSAAARLVFRAQAADAAPAFTGTRYDIGARPRTADSVVWVPPAWTTGVAGDAQRTPDLKSMVQRVVGRSGWASGNPIVIIVNGSGVRTAWAWDGSAASAPLLHVEYSGGAPPVDQPPVASLAVTQLANPPLSVSASAAGSTDTDATPIASYSFNWGDGTTATVVNAPTQIATHTYASAGTYTVTLIATDTGALASAPKTASITVNPPAPDLPPVASLAVTQLASPALTVSASGAGSTDTDATPIASYSFNWGDGTTATVVNAPTQTATHTYAAAGPYTVTLIVTDTGAQASAQKTADINVTASVAVTTVEARVAASTDDAEQALTGSMSLTSSDLELIHDGSDQIVGMRWTGLAIPTGATIRAAWIQFTSKEAQTEVTNLVLKAQAADNAATFTSTTNNISSRTLTTAAAAWAPVAWTSGLAGANQRTPDLSDVVREVVGRPGWAFGNALAIIVSGTGHRTAWAWNGSATSAALLHIEYSGGSAPVDNPPVANLAVTQAPSPPLTVSASAAGSTDTDITPIASYSFDWGDGSSPTVVNAPGQTASHTYASTGTYTVTLTAKDTGGLTSAPVSSSVNVVATPAAKVAVYVGYYDTHHSGHTQPKPSPWEGSPGVVFVGKADDSAYNWDSSALRVDNLTGASMTVLVSCDIGSKRFDLWGSRTIPAGGILVLAQTAFQNFDGSDTSPAGCYGCDPSLCLTKVVSTIPVIHVTVAGVLTNYYDNTQVLNTKGADGAGCPYTGGRNDESQQWKQIGTTAAAIEGTPDENGEFVPERMTFDAPAPNPVRDWMVIRFMLPKASRVAVDILDVAGRRVRTSLERDMPAGIFQQGVTLEGLDPGVYYCQVRTAYGSMHRPVVVSR